MELFSLDPGLAIWTWISFGILFFILSRYVFPVLMGNLREREKKIARSVDNADRIQQRLAEIDLEYEKTIADARKEADDMLVQTRQEVEELRQKLLVKAEEEARDIVEQTRHKMEEERQIMLQNLQQEIARFVCDTSERVIGTSFTSDRDRDWARELVKTL